MAAIDNMRQNHPELVVRDLASGNHETIKNKIRLVLKERGINKWLRNRRLTIQLKDRWKKEITELQKDAALFKELYEFTGNNSFKIDHIKALARMNALADCRQQLRAICHSKRDVNFPIDSLEWGNECDLPEDFPNRPSKNYFCK